MLLLQDSVCPSCTTLRDQHNPEEKVPTSTTSPGKSQFYHPGMGQVGTFLLLCWGQALSRTETKRPSSLLFPGDCVIYSVNSSHKLAAPPALGFCCCSEGFP